MPGTPGLDYVPPVGFGSWYNETGFAAPQLQRALVDRWDYQGDSEAPTNDRTLDYGKPPMRIPRLWNQSVGALSGAKQWGFPSFFWRLRIPPVPIVHPNRGRASVAMGQSAGRDRQTADTMYVPAIFVGWNPPNIGQR